MQATHTTKDSICRRHKNISTNLYCTRCEDPICPRCMENSPTGFRCPDCGKTSRLPTYDTPLSILLRDVLVTISSGLVSGVLLYGLYRSLVNIGIPMNIRFYIFLGMIGISGLIVGEAISLTCNRKRGWLLRVISMVGVTFSIIILSILTGLGFSLFFNYSVIIAVLCGFWLAANRL